MYDLTYRGVLRELNNFLIFLFRLYFDDNLFFEVHEDVKQKKYLPRPESQVSLHSSGLKSHPLPEALASTYPMGTRRDSASNNSHNSR